MPSEPNSSGDEIEIIEPVAQSNRGLKLVKKRKGENGPDGKEWKRGRESSGKRPRHTISGISPELNAPGLGHHLAQTRPAAASSSTSPSISKENNVIGTNEKKSKVNFIVNLSGENTKTSPPATGMQSFTAKGGPSGQQNNANTRKSKLVARKSTGFMSRHSKVFGRQRTPTGSASESDSSNPQHSDTDKDTQPIQSIANPSKRQITARKSAFIPHNARPSPRRLTPSTGSESEKDKDTQPTQNSANIPKRQMTARKSATMPYSANPHSRRLATSTGSTSDSHSSNSKHNDEHKGMKDTQATTHLPGHVMEKTPQSRTSLPNSNDGEAERKVSIAKSKRHSGPSNPSEVIVIESSGDEGSIKSLPNKLAMSSKQSRPAALNNSMEKSLNIGPSDVMRTENGKERKKFSGPNLNLMEAINQTYSLSSRQKPERKSSGTKALVNDIIDLTLDDSDDMPISDLALGLTDRPRILDKVDTNAKSNSRAVLPRETVQLHAEPTRTSAMSQASLPSGAAVSSPQLPTQMLTGSNGRPGFIVGPSKPMERHDISPQPHHAKEYPSDALPKPRSPSKSIEQPQKSKSPVYMAEDLPSDNRFKLPPPLNPKASDPSSNASPSAQSPEGVEQQISEEMEECQAILEELDLPESRVTTTEEQEGDADDEAEVNNQILSRSTSDESSPDPVLPTLRRSLRHNSGSSYSDSGHPSTFIDGEMVETPPDSSPSPGPEKREIAPTYGGFAALTWAQYKKDVRNFNLKYYLAKDLPTSLPDSVNRLSDYTRMDRGIADVFHAFILESIVEDEAGTLDIDVINAVDNEPTPLFEFNYTNRIWYGEGVPLPNYSQLHGCDCVGKCDPRSKTCICAIKQREYLEMEDGFVYDKNGRLKYHGYPIFECNEMCGCDDDCRNRVVQHGRKCQVVIKKTLDKGWGVFNGSKRLPSGTFIGVYAGELLTDGESETRGRLYNKTGRTYLFDIDFYHLQGKGQESWTSKYTVDAYHAGNFTRFLNHSCDPNTRLFACYVNEPDIEKPLLVAFSIRDIEPHEEICFNYAGRYPGEESDDEEEKDAIDRNDPIYSDCRCGARNCRGVMFN